MPLPVSVNVKGRFGDWNGGLTLVIDALTQNGEQLVLTRLAEDRLTGTGTSRLRWEPQGDNVKITCDAYDWYRQNWQKVAGPSVVNDGLLSGTVHFGAVGAPSLVTLWSKTKSNVGVKGVAAVG